MRNASGDSFKFENYITASDLLTLVNEIKLFGQAEFFSFLFPLRSPSETLLMAISGDEDRIAEPPPQKFKILVGIRRILNTDMLIAKFPRLKNVRRCCILLRPFLCEESSAMERVISPSHPEWPLVRERAPMRVYLPPTYSAAKFSNAIKRRAKERAFPLSGKYPHLHFDTAPPRSFSLLKIRWARSIGLDDGPD